MIFPASANTIEFPSGAQLGAESAWPPPGAQRVRSPTRPD